MQYSCIIYVSRVTHLSITRGIAVKLGYRANDRITEFSIAKRKCKSALRDLVRRAPSAMHGCFFARCEFEKRHASHPPLSLSDVVHAASYPTSPLLTRSKVCMEHRNNAGIKRNKRVRRSTSSRASNEGNVHGKRRFLPGSIGFNSRRKYAQTWCANAKCADYTRLRPERSAAFIVDYLATATFATYQYNT